MTKKKVATAKKAKNPKKDSAYAAFHAAAKRKPTYVQIKDFGKVQLKPIEVGDYQQFLAFCAEKPSEALLNAFLLEKSAHQKGKRIIPDGGYKELPNFESLPHVRLVDIGNTICRISGIGVDYSGN